MMSTLPKVVLVQLVYNGMRYIPQSVASMVNQTYTNTEVVCVIHGNDDGGKEYIAEHFPGVTIIDPGANLKFAKGHNLVFEQVSADFYQLVNQDAILELNYVEEMLKGFVNEQVGAVNGKVLQYDFAANKPNGKIDSTGLTYSRGGRGRSRGQHEVDTGQYDNQLEIIGVDGSACMYRRSALEAVKMPRPNGGFEYFDEDFDMYWEDTDLSLRMVNAGYTARYVPSAVAYHGRTAGSTPGGYKKVWAFFKTHRRMNPLIRQWNYKNHQFVFIKNSPRWYWQFFAREFFYHMYLLGLEVFLFDFATVKVLPLYFKQLPLMFAKRKTIAQTRKISTAQFTKLLS